MQTELSILLPVFNEREEILRNVLPMVHRVEALLGTLPFEVLVLDNGSTDGTEELKSRFQSVPKVRFLRTERRGRGIALNLGFGEARGEVIAVLSIDRAWDETFLLQALGALRRGADVVLGQKSNPRSSVSRPMHRQVLSMFTRFFIGFLFSTPPQDTQCIKAFRKASVPFLAVLGNYNYFAETEFFLRSVQNRLRVVSLPVSVRDRRRGSKVRLQTLWEFLKEALSFRRSVWMH